MNQILDNLSPSEVFGLTIIGEARGEPVEGQIAVGNVVRNRMNFNPAKYKTYKDVCLEEKQFSCWNLNDPNYTFLLDLGEKLIMGQGSLLDSYFKQCMYIAKGVEGYQMRDNVNGCRYYMTKTLFDTERPIWAKAARNIFRIGNHVFFNV